MIDENRIENLYNVIKLDEEVQAEEIKSKAKENIVAIYLSMDQLSGINSYKMQQRVSEVKEYITLLEKEIEDLTPTPTNPVPLEYQTDIWVNKKDAVMKDKIIANITKFDYEYEKAKRKNDKDRADFYWELSKNFRKLLGE